MKVIAFFLVLQAIRLQPATCQGGGPSTFGYDASSACSKPYSRTGRARLNNLPCDFRRQNWCTVAGSSYPWQAVRRFVRENQGLMRRMYGDEKHINVLKEEFDRNDIELKYDDYYQHLTENSRGFHYDDDYEFLDEDQRSSRIRTEEYEGRGFTSRSFHEPSTRRIKYPKLSEYGKRQLKATEDFSAAGSTSTTTSSTSTSTTTTEATTVESSTSTGVSSSSSTSPSSSSATSSSTISTYTTVSSASTDTTTKQESSTIASSSTEKALNVSSAPENENTVTVAQIVNEQNFSINEIVGQVDRIDENLEESIELPHVPALGEEEDSTLKTAEIDSADLPIAPSSTTVTTSQEDFTVDKETTVHESFFSKEPQYQQQFRPRPEYRPYAKPETSGMEGQLYQDVAAKDQQDQPVLKLRGINACPVKEEVVAPFWANNTRGEVLALLNLYPFEQYVHWEKCTHENKQMYCRDGCRCEQQYRLHRLLAYDPNNECRGIFSDWFKFPSCCVCRCYDLPLEFRVTSRSPRTQRQRIKVQSPRSRFA